MGRDFSLTKEDIENANKKKTLLKAPISYMADESLEIPNLESNFTPNEVKKKEKIKIEVVDLKKKKEKNKSNKLL